MRAWSLFSVTLVAIVAWDCGGSTIDYGGSDNPNDPNNPNNPNRPNPQGIPTIAQGGDFTLLPSPGVGHASVSTLVGSSPTDIWGAGSDNGLYHWDGNTWTQVPIGPPASTGNLEEHLASAGPGAVWIAHEYGVVRVDTSGNAEDHTSDIGPSGQQDIVRVDSSADMTVVTDIAKNAAFSYGGGKFTQMPALVGAVGPQNRAPVDTIAVRSASDVWVGYSLSQGAHFDGTAWALVNVFGGPGGASMVPFAPGKMGLLMQAASVCPDWCHPNAAPYGETTSSGWLGQIFDAKSLPGSGGTETLPAPSDLDPSLAYEGVTAEGAADGNLALVGCAFSQTDTPQPSCSSGGPCVGPVGEYVGHYVVHEWDGTALHARPLTNSPECSAPGAPSPGPFVPSARPLLDGTWVLPAIDSGYGNDPYVGAAAVLMKP